MSTKTKNETKVAHTPTPYRVAKFSSDKYTIIHGHGKVPGVAGETVTIIAETEGASPGDFANAAFMVRACNRYADHDLPGKSTLREYFAGQAISGMYACQDFINELENQVGSKREARKQLAQFAYRQAEAMLTEREKESTEP